MKITRKAALSAAKKHKQWVLAGGIVTVVLAGLLVWRPWMKPAEGLPKKTLAQINVFQPYYFTPDLPEGFTLNKQSVRYENNILLFNIRDATRNQTVSVTEQLLPESLSGVSYPDATNVPGVDGKAIIKYDGTRLIGGLFSTKHHNRQTFILLNSTDPIPQSQVEDMLRSLRPAK
jgi:hypothetical protein